VHRPRTGAIRLWTVQPKLVWESLLKRGELYVDLTQIETPIEAAPYAWAYDYMREQMAQRLPNYQGHYPWWAWFDPKPDLRRAVFRRYAPPGTRAVRLKLAIPAERVLLSNYQAWFCVLNRWQLWLGDEEAEPPEFESVAARQQAEADRAAEPVWPLSAPWQFRIVPSWERMFDLEATRSGWGSEVQATFERLELADVVAVTEFTAM
jgi:hypothetical protein